MIIFDFIKQSNGQNLFKRIFCSLSEKTRILLLLLILALIIIMIMFNFEIRDTRNQYQALKNLYINQMFISKDEFEKFIRKPRYINMYNILLVSLLIVLVIRFFIPISIFFR